MNRYDIEHNRKFHKVLTTPMYRGFLYVLITLVVVGSLGMFLYQLNLNRIQENNDYEQFNEIDIVINEIQSQLRFSGTPLMLATGNKSIAKVIEGSDVENKDFVGDVLLSMISNMDNIDQIRILDLEGNELIRVDQDNSGNFMKIPDDELQNKGERYYFKETIEITDDSIYVSPLDLNMEYGEIELPIKPMIRIGKPIFTSDGEMIGAMVINVRGQNLLDILDDFKMHANDEVLLVNTDGYYLAGGNELDFSFMYESEQDKGFYSDYPEVWTRVVTGENKIVYNKDQFYVKEMNPIKTDELVKKNVSWYVIIHMEEADVEEAERIFKDAIKYIVAILGPLLIVLSYMLGTTQARNLSFRDELLKSSTYDTLTGIYNRRFIMKVLHQSVVDAKNENKPLSILYIDVNNLKHVNDTSGHSMGDKMIVAAGTSIKESVRGTDIVARIGGDEFLVVLPNCVEENVNGIIVKIAVAFLEKGMEYVNEPWEMSYGCAVLREDETEAQLIQRADHYMYENKRNKKDS